MRQVPGREPEWFAPRSLRPGPFMPVFLYWFLYPSLFLIRHFDVPGP